MKISRICNILIVKRKSRKEMGKNPIFFMALLVKEEKIMVWRYRREVVNHMFSNNKDQYITYKKKKVNHYIKTKKIKDKIKKLSRSYSSLQASKIKVVSTTVIYKKALNLTHFPRQDNLSLLSISKKRAVRCWSIRSSSK